MSFRWSFTAKSEGILIRCEEKGLLSRFKPVSVADWPREEQLPGRALLEILCESEDGVLESEGALLTQTAVSRMTEAQAARLGLPPSVPYAIELNSKSTFDEPTFEIAYKWVRSGGIPVHLKRQGSIAYEGDAIFRVPFLLMCVIDAVQEYKEADLTSRQKRVAAWLPVQEAIEHTLGTGISSDGYLRDLRIFHAGSFSLSLDMTVENGVTFDPVLFGRAAILRAETPDLFEADPLADPVFDEDLQAFEEDEGSRNADLVDEADHLLTPELQRRFIKNCYDPDPECRDAYPLVRGNYVVFDPALRQALNVVKAKQGGTSAERRAFVKNPRESIARALDLSDDAPELNGLFVETQQYADRVRDIGIWEQKVLPWLPRTENTWLPEKIGFSIDGRNIEIAPEELSDVLAACENAINEGQPIFEFKGESAIPASEETRACLQSLLGVAEDIQNKSKSKDDKESEDDTKETSTRYVLEHDENFEELLYELGLRPRASEMRLTPPPALMAPDRLFPHQQEGFEWLAKSWIAGRPGVLLADDMGLGKTVQTLGFAAWLHENLGGKRGPFLIVAPTALLRNWQSEHDVHLLGDGIGPIVELYGSNIRNYRTATATNGPDVRDGHAGLDRAMLAEASVILTTYETLANYHLSFASIRFPLVVFDEIQKIKNATTINAHAARNINADYVLGLTGTPVENALSELWSIMDRLHPGLYGDLRSFSQKYRADDVGSLRELHDDLTIPPHPQIPAVMMRRMKDTTDLGKALPTRTFHTIVNDMPPAQAEAYGSCIAEAKRIGAEGAQKGDMLTALQQMRSLSLHHLQPLQVLGNVQEYDSYIGGSARLQGAFEALDDIHARSEKALLFIEFREMQRLLADIIRHRYDLSRLPAIINGQTPAARRQDTVSEFQSRPTNEFDVLLLSPRAAGVGLTITAATHVIHISRWWNPAVEDQCNDRAYRIGQEKEVAVYHPLARHPYYGEISFDLALDALLERKRKLSKDLLVPTDSADDYTSMFRDAVATASE